MAKLALEITHSLSFLSSFIRQANDMYKNSIDAFSDIDAMKISDEHYGRDLRNYASDYRKDADKVLELEEDDYQLFSIEITDIISKRNDEEVIYTMSKYKKILELYKKLNKSIDNSIDRYENKKNQCTNDKDFIRVIAYNKVLVPLYRIFSMTEHIIKRLSTLTNEKNKG